MRFTKCQRGARPPLWGQSNRGRGRETRPLRNAVTFGVPAAATLYRRGSVPAAETDAPTDHSQTTTFSYRRVPFSHDFFLSLPHGIDIEISIL